MNVLPQTEGPGWNVLRELYATRRACDLQGVVHELETAGVGADTGMALYRLMRETKPRRTLETGFAFGFSTLFMLQAHHDNGSGTHVAIDPVETTRWHGIGLANVARAGLGELFEHLEMLSQLALPSLMSNGVSIDLAFVDGSHLFDETLLDAYFIDRMLPVGGYLVFDDWGWMPAVRAAVNFFETNLPYAADESHSAKNIRVLKKTERPSRAWNHFVPFEVLSSEQIKARNKSV